jgi:REP-associated tyrosine transposase
MPRYRRAIIEGGIFFFTVTLADRSSDLLVRHIEHLRRIYGMIQKRQPFETIAIYVTHGDLPPDWGGRPFIPAVALQALLETSQKSRS